MSSPKKIFFLSARCAENRERWDSLCSIKSAQVTYLNDALALALGNRYHLPTSVDLDPEASVEIPANRPVQILVTGSLHLVGGVLELVKPDVCHMTKEELAREGEIVREYLNITENVHHSGR